MMNTEKKLSTEDRINRLERLVVRSLLSASLDMKGSRLIDVESFPRATQMALTKRLDKFNPAAISDETKYAVDSILSICKDDIAAEQSMLDDATVKREAAEKDKKVTAAKAEKAAADEASRIAQKKLDALDK